MLQISDEALALAREKKMPITIGPMHCVESCCFTFAPCPDVKFGRPKREEDFLNQEIRGIEVYTPRFLPDHPLTIAVSRVWRHRRLVLEGWRLV